MSRTDIHRPFRVQMRDPYARHWFAEHHDHSTGACDLDGFLSSATQSRARCYRQPTDACPNLCGCTLCTGRPQRKLARRQERVTWRSARARLLAAARAGERDLDVHPIRAKAW
ncbi:hypothetical protein [Micromonospora chalcea]|uniref:hypothetical protein n=1 Tax=Micromonospora chalcea TaxID=1874 RepID=UPI003D73AB80